ncbi:hypothetical protein DASC09_043710 [Saccharomycopsis crataegensis]|uniref:Zn(2)-C6 fungal-type domain-containing protein n=1 Tax=Saccharomycopsis crataegensis TaxID=43959 RepID=A0AAV5QQN0_9ASCO|nr:hypothetical protein DASC09_043710 [Saccharomycopsis crataegensis]
MAKKSKGSSASESMVSKASGDKKSRSRSCLLCQKRKQKCDHRLPSCTTCLKAGVKCVQPEKYSVDAPIKDEYTIVLERRIQYLESMIDDSSGNFKSGALSKYKKMTPYIENHETSSQTMTNDDAFITNTIKTETMTEPTSSSSLSLQRTNTFDPGIADDIVNSLEIPTFSLMNDPMRQIPEFDAHGKIINPSRPFDSQTPPPVVKPLNPSSANNTHKIMPDLPPSNGLSISLAGPIDLSETILGKYDFKEILKYDPEYVVDDQLSRTLIDTHFIRFQIKFPFLNEKEVMDFYNAYQGQKLAGFMNDSNYFYFSCCRMWLIYSLNSFILKTTGDYKHLAPLRLFSTALRSLSKCKVTDPYQQIEIYLLVILCLIRCDRDAAEIYRLIGDAMKLAVKLDLHKYSSYLSCREDDERLKKMKCFWCVYLLDRLISVSVGKPFNFPEKSIDPDIPLFEDDPAKTNFVKDFTENSSPGLSNGTEAVLYINQAIKLKRIEAKAMESLNIVGSNSQVSTVSELPLVEYYFDQLQNWRKECTVIMNQVEQATLALYYFRTVRVLIQPYLELMQPEDRLLKECQAAAGQICQLFKVFHQKTVYGHSILAINNVFVAGVTLIYCLWLTRNIEDKRRRLLGDKAKHTRLVMTPEVFTSLDDLKACSICLFVMAERSKYAIVFRDTFDELSRSTCRSLVERCGADSTELMYNNKKTNTYDSNTIKKRVGNETMKTWNQNHQLSNGNIKENGKPNEENNESKNDSASVKIESEVMPPAVVRRPVTHYDIIPDYHGLSSKTLTSKFKQQLQKEKEENKRKRGALEKSTVPKSLSHLLIAIGETPEGKKNTQRQRQKANKENQKKIKQVNEVAKSQKTLVAELGASKDGGNTSNYSGFAYGDIFGIGHTQNGSTVPSAGLFNNTGSTNYPANHWDGNNDNSETTTTTFFNSPNSYGNHFIDPGSSNNVNAVNGFSFGQLQTPLGMSNLLSGSGLQIPFTDRANDMINNISNWNEENGSVNDMHQFMANDFLNNNFGTKKFNSTTNQIFADLETLNTLAMNVSEDNGATNDNGGFGGHDNFGNVRNNISIKNEDDNNSDSGDSVPPYKKKKFDTQSLFNGNFRVNQKGS